MAWITLFHLNIRMERTQARAKKKRKSAMLYFEIMKTTGNNDYNRHAKHLVGGIIKILERVENFALSSYTLDSGPVLVEYAIIKNEFTPFKLL